MAAFGGVPVTSYNRFKRGWYVLLLVGAALTFVAASQARSKPLKCRTGYISRAIWVPKRKHGRIVRHDGKVVYHPVRACVKKSKPKHKSTPPPTSITPTGPPTTITPPPAVPTPPANIKVPQITGGGHAGQMMSATSGTWSGDQPMSLSYQWQDCDQSGANCQNVSNGTNSTYTVQDSDVGKTLSVIVTATNDGGSASASSPTTNQMKYFVLVAVGDIACAPNNASENAISGNPTTTTSTQCQQQATADIAAAQHPDAVLMLGDGQYWSGALSEYNAVFANTWGTTLKQIPMYPVPGNHEYYSSSKAAGYFSYFGSAANPMNTPEGYYSFNLGSWHFDALNSNCDSSCSDLVRGGTPAGSAQVSWLKSDLAADRSACTLAFWHHPYYSAGDIGNNPDDAPFWSALYNAHADVVLNGHDHIYERYPQLDPSGNQTSSGIREFVAGTGGENLVGYWPSNVTTPPGAPAYDDATEFGVTVFTLHTNSYDWKFVATNGAVRDQGSSTCHGSASAGNLAARDVTTRAPAALYGPPLAFGASPMRASLTAALRFGLPVAIHVSRSVDISIRASVRRAGHLENVASFYETESEIAKRYSVIYLRLPARQLKGIRHVTLVLRFSALDAGGHHRVVTRTVGL